MGLGRLGRVLNDLSLRTLATPEKGQKIYRDGSLPGFGVRVSQGGSKSFVLVHGTDKRLITIGRYPIISLSQARTEAKRLLAEFTLGKVRPQSITYPQAVELFVAEKKKARRERTAEDYRRHLNRLNFKGQLIEITPHEFARRLDRFKAPSTRSHILVAAKVFFRWCLNRRYLEHNPTVGLQKPPYIPRDRVLTDQELRDIWKATADLSLFDRIIRAAILTGQRRGELVQLTADHIKDGVCTTPPHIAKNGREHAWPIGPLASQYLPLQPFNNWGDAKKKLDIKSGVVGWTIHDCRRSFATRMAELGTAPHIIERILNHATGSLSAIARVYNRARYLEEMRDAVAKYEAHLSRVLKLS